MKTPIVGYQGKQLTLDFNLDRPQLSICPKCSSDIIRLAEGCHICGWSENQSRSVESSLSIPCTVKQPKQLERQNWDERLILYISDSNAIATVYKLLVYPDFSGVGHIDQCSSKIIPPSKIRREKGEGSGHIYYRTVTRNGKEYQQAYYQWRENGQQRTKYIPKKLLDKVQEAESRKLSVSDILVLLGCIEKCSSKSSDTLDKCSSKNIHPSKKRCDPALCGAVSFRAATDARAGRGLQEQALSTGKSKSTNRKVPSRRTPRQRREKGRGTAYIECKPITKNGKQYKQYWFHWQVWRDGETVIKKSRYIPKRLVSKVERMNNEKESVEKILKVLESKSKRRK